MSKKDYSLDDLKLDLELLDSYDENYRIERQKAKAKKEKLKRDKIRKKTKLAVTTFYTIMCVAVGSASYSYITNVIHINFGKSSIANDVYQECLTGINCVDRSYGKQFNFNTKYVSYEDAISEIKSRANASGIDDVKLYIALDRVFDDGVAKDVVGKISKSDINECAYQEYLNKELERVKANGRK